MKKTALILLKILFVIFFAFIGFQLFLLLVVSQILFDFFVFGSEKVFEKLNKENGK
jgi:hypothetical protein